MSLLLQIVTTIGKLAVIAADLMAGRKTEAEARAECIAAGRLIMPGSATDELAAHERDASLPGG
ncbi:MAG: hypothetical protein RBU35_20630 [Anaerolineae bacterium]|jgi:hypothetical protein|nr:hypothetical protein [Anaerolineae bacterium]